METRQDSDPSDPSVNRPHYLVEEEYTIGVPMVRPKTGFLKLLRLAGAKGEVFTVKEICDHLKKYISSRSLYDMADPRKVHCGRDLLGQVFNVTSFTIHEVLGLIDKNCYAVPDMCWKKRRRIINKPFSTQTTPSKVTSSSIWGDFPPDVPGVPDEETLKEQAGLAGTQQEMSVTADGPSSSTGRSAMAGSEVSVMDGEGSQSVPIQTECKANDQQTMQRKRKNRKRKSNSSGSDVSRRKRHNTEPGSSTSTSMSSRRRGTSLSITYHDDDDSDGDCPFCVMVKMKSIASDVNNKDDDDESEVLSIQDKETISVRDSTDDLWFLEEEESISVHVDSDAEFSVEYEIESDAPSHYSESDVSSVTSGNGLLVVCKESDVEFFADYSDTESETEDREFSKGDNWTCSVCQQSNLPIHRCCFKCWNIRPDWLPGKPASQSIDKVSKSLYGSVENDIASNKLSGVRTKDDDVFVSDVGQVDQVDSGVCLSSQPSSQENISLPCQPLTDKESGLFVSAASGDKSKSVSDMFKYQASLVEETQASEIRHSFSNIQVKTLSSSTSLNSGGIKDQSKDVAGEGGNLAGFGEIVASNGGHLVETGKVYTCKSETLLENSGAIAGKTDVAKIGSSPLDDPCIVCLTQCKNASLIHGTSGHQVCCYTCAKRLKRRGKLCPVCRRPIQKVVKNYIL